jgi:hypothetical protein
MSKLLEGLIPPNTLCPFANVCPLSGPQEQCQHKGTEHTSFSCASARAFDLMEYQKEGTLVVTGMAALRKGR